MPLGGGEQGIGIFPVVANYSALPAPATVPGVTYVVLNSQGSRLFFNYYSKGLYYSDGTSWIYTDTPIVATQAEMDAGVNGEKYGTPATINALLKWSTKQDALVSGTSIKTIEGQNILGSGNIDITKSDVGLGNADNTSDANKPISTATQTALNLKEDSSNKSTTMTGNESSNAVFLAAKAIYDWATGLFQLIVDQFATTIAALPATLDLTHANRWVRVSATGTLTVPPNSSVAYPIGTRIMVRQIGTGSVTLAPGAGVTLNAPGGVLTTGSQYDVIRLVKQGTDSWLVEVGAASWYASIVVPRLSAKYHVVKFMHTALTPADSTTYYVPAYPTSAVNVTSAARRTRAVESGFVTHVVTGIFAGGVLGSSETITVQVANVTTAVVSTASTTMTWDSAASNNRYVLSSPLAYSANDEIELRIVMPAFATNPTNVMANYDVYFRNS